MHLVYLSNAFVPSREANSIQIMKMCQAFARIIDGVQLFCRKTDQAVDNVYRYYGVEENFDIERVHVPAVRFIRRMLYARAIVHRLRAIRKPYVLFGRDYYVMGLIAMQRRIRVPMSLEIHQPPVDRVQHFLQKQIFRHPDFRQLVVISQALADEYLRIYGGLLAGKITVAHDGADTGQIPAAMLESPDFGQRSDRFRLGYIGSLYPGKGMDMIARLARLVPDCEFHVVGGKDPEVQLWKEKCPENNLIFHGFVEPERVYEYMAAFDVMLAPYQPSVKVGSSQVDIARWMSPLKLFEYMAGARPIICSDLPVLQEVMTDGHNGLLASATDPQSWVAQIRRLQADEALRRRLGMEAQAGFFGHYTWEKRAEHILSALLQQPVPAQANVL
ncbi:MAG: hypothetical protein OHK0039_32720 [Bacteroidia bacterium]